MFLGSGGGVPAGRGRVGHGRRLFGRTARESDLRGRLLGKDRPCGDRRGRIRPVARLLRAASGRLLGEPRPDDVEPPGAGRRRAVQVRHLRPYAGAAGRSNRVEGETGEERQVQTPDRHADPAGLEVLAGRGVPPALPGEARPRSLPYLTPVAVGVLVCVSKPRGMIMRTRVFLGFLLLAVLSICAMPAAAEQKKEQKNPGSKAQRSASDTSAARPAADTVCPADDRFARAGFRAFIDPQTGQLRPPTPEEAQALSRAARAEFAQPAESLQAVVHPDGMVSVDLKGL